MKNVYRHGDVLLKSINIPSKAKKVKASKQLTIAEGEATGHHHTLYSDLPIDLLEYNENRYLKIKESVDLKHQEHSVLKIEPGQYEITIEQEYDYFEESMKKVVD